MLSQLTQNQPQSLFSMRTLTGARLVWSCSGVVRKQFTTPQKIIQVSTNSSTSTSCSFLICRLPACPIKITTKPQTHCTVSFFSDLSSALCMHANHGHHSRLAWKCKTLPLESRHSLWHHVSLLASQCIMQFLSRSLLYSSGQMGSFY